MNLPRSRERYSGLQVLAFLLLAVLLIAAIMSAIPGCAAVAPGNDPAVVTAERSLSVSFDTINAFLEAENDNRAAVAHDLPAVHAFAATLRRDAPAALTETRDAIRAYKASRTAPDGDAMNAKLARIQSLARTAREYLIRVQTK